MGSETESVLILLAKTSSRSHCRVVRRSVVEQPTTAQSLILLFSLIPLTFTFLLRGVCNWFKRCRVSLLWKLLLKACRNMFCWISEKIIYTSAKTMFYATGPVAVSVLFPVALIKHCRLRIILPHSIKLGSAAFGLNGFLVGWIRTRGLTSKG